MSYMVLVRFTQYRINYNFIESAPSLIQSINRNVHVLFVCLSVSLPGTQDCANLRLMFKERIAKIEIPRNPFLRFDIFFSRCSRDWSTTPPLLTDRLIE